MLCYNRVMLCYNRVRAGDVRLVFCDPDVEQQKTIGII